MFIDFKDLKRAKLKNVKRLARWMKIPGVWRTKACRLRCEVDDNITELRYQDLFKKPHFRPGM
jgi:hypothetical protein